MGIISYFQARRIISNGCESYIIHICDVIAECSSLDSVHIVHNFFDVFLIVLPGLAPKHHIEFIFDLELGIQHIFM